MTMPVGSGDSETFNAGKFTGKDGSKKQARRFDKVPELQFSSNEDTSSPVVNPITPSHVVTQKSSVGNPQDPLSTSERLSSVAKEGLKSPSSITGNAKALPVDDVPKGNAAPNEASTELVFGSSPRMSVVEQMDLPTPGEAITPSDKISLEEKRQRLKYIKDSFKELHIKTKLLRNKNKELEALLIERDTKSGGEDLSQKPAGIGRIGRTKEKLKTMFKVKHSKVNNDISDLQSRITKLEEEISRLHADYGNCLYKTNKLSKEVDPLLTEISKLEKKFAIVDVPREIESLRINNPYKVGGISVTSIALTVPNIIGRGLDGAVYKLEDNPLAVAKVAEYFGLHQDEMFVEEAKIGLAISGLENVVNTLGVTTQQVPDPSDPEKSLTQNVLVMEKVDAGELQVPGKGPDIESCLQRINDLPPKERKAVKQDLIYTAAIGLMHIHAKHVIHRDFAARNVFVQEYTEQGKKRYKSKVGDPSRSVQLNSDDDSYWDQSKEGPVKWMAPEAIQETQENFKKSDVYSFAIFIMEVLTGETLIPENQEKVGDTVKVINGETVLEVHNQKFPGINSKFAELVKECSNPDPENRPTMAQVVARMKEMNVFADLHEIKPL